MSEAFVWPQLSSRSADLNPAEARQRAEAAGRADGFQQGLEEGRAAAAAELREIRERAAATLEDVEVQLREHREQQVDGLAGIVHALCCRVLGHELLSNVGVLEAVLAEAVSRLEAGAGEAEVFVNPEDHAAISGLYQGALPLHTDAGVPRYGISVRLPTQAVDFQPMTLVDELFEDVRNDGAR